jgi:hypothetical protein
MKYELTEETKTLENGIVVRRIRYADGSLGGWLETKKNLSQKGGARVFGDAQVSGGAQVSGKARVFGDAQVSGGAQVSGDARVSGDAQVSGGARVFGGAWVSGDAQVSGGARVFGDAQVSGDARVFGGAWVFGKARVFGGAWVSGKAQVFGGAWVSGDAWNKSPLQIQGTRFFFCVSSADTITVGCNTHTVTEWVEIYEKKFDEHHFTNEERLEYKLYFNLAVRRYGWDVPLLPVDDPL